MIPAPLHPSNVDFRRIEEALRRAFPDVEPLRVDREHITARDGDVQIHVSPAYEPVDRPYEFFRGVATAEIELRDAGVRVNLIPHAVRRVLAVTQPRHAKGRAFLTTDNSLSDDLARHTGGQHVGFEGYLYDSPEDLSTVLAEARAEHPDADFSLVPD